jgi:hypothetical protein
MPLNKKIVNGSIIEIITELADSLDKNLKEAKPLLLLNSITEHKIKYIKYLIESIKFNINATLIEDRCLTDVQNVLEDELHYVHGKKPISTDGRLSEITGPCIKTDLILNYYNSFGVILSNIRNQLYINSLLFDSIISGPNFLGSENILLIEYCYTIYTILNNLYVHINNLEIEISALKNRAPEVYYYYLHHIFDLTRRNKIKIYTYEVTKKQSDDTVIGTEDITPFVPTKAGPERCINIDEIDEMGISDTLCDPTFYPVSKLKGGNKKYKKTNNKVDFTYKNKKYTRIIYLNSKNKKYVRLNNEYLLLSKLQKNK